MLIIKGQNHFVFVEDTLFTNAELAIPMQGQEW